MIEREGRYIGKEGARRSSGGQDIFLKPSWKARTSWWVEVFVLCMTSLKDSAGDYPLVFDLRFVSKKNQIYLSHSQDWGKEFFI